MLKYLEYPVLVVLALLVFFSFKLYSKVFPALQKRLDAENKTIQPLEWLCDRLDYRHRQIFGKEEWEH